jgi:hypothetical protein
LAQPRTIYCTRHPGEPAAFLCKKCRYALCPKCAMGTVIQFTSMVRCTSCGGEAKLLLVAGAFMPYWKKAPSFFKALVSPRGLGRLFGLSLLLAGIAYIPVAGLALAWALFGMYYFMVVRDSARGRVSLPLPRDTMDFLDFLADLFFSCMRLLLSTCFLVGIGVAYLSARGKMLDVWLEPGLLWKDPVIVVLGVLMVLYLPGVLVISTISESMIGPLNPVYTIRRMVPVYRQYLLTVLVWVTLLALDHLLLTGFGAAVARDSIFLLTRFLHVLLGIVLPLASAWVLGRFVFQNGEAFGVVPAGEFLVAADPGGEPRGTLDDG